MALLLQIVLAQRPHREPADKGPRAMGLIEFSPNGKAHLIPVTIMVDGKFYDAGSYKASPVPMALDSGTVYEAMRSGVSQGLFTVSGALEGQSTWRGEGTWRSATEMQAEADRKKAREALKPPKKNDDQDAPPVLRRAGSDKSVAGNPGPDKPSSGKSGPDKSGTEKSGADTPKTSRTVPPTSPSESTGATGESSSASSAAPAAASTPSPSSASDENDPDRPHLRRGQPTPQPKPIDETAHTAPPAPKNSQRARSGVGPMPPAQIIPAISDAGGPEPRSFAFEVKPDEERQFLTKMLAMAALEVSARARVATSDSSVTHQSTARKSKPPKSPEPTFDDVQLRVFDLSSNNEPILVLTAKSQLAAAHLADHTSVVAEFMITVVAREDIYGDLHKALSNVTDTQHLDVLPRLDLIDAVDIDGDGRGELLFRRVSDSGTGYAVYRVIGNQLWPLYESAAR